MISTPTPIPSARSVASAPPPRAAFRFRRFAAVALAVVAPFASVARSSGAPAPTPVKPATGSSAMPSTSGKSAAASASIGLSASSSASGSASVAVAIGGAGLVSAAPSSSAIVLTAHDELLDDAVLPLAEALEIFHQRGFDLLIADAAIYSAEGDEKAAGAILNPTVTAGYGRGFGYDPIAGCPKLDDGTQPSCGTSSNQYLVGVTDNGAIVENLVGKRPLRLKVARAALQTVKLTKFDTQRQLDGQLKAAYVQLALAIDQLAFAKEIQASATKTLTLNKLRYPSVIDEGALARIETAKLEADSGVDTAEQSIVNARAGVAFLLGVRGLVPKFVTTSTALTFAVPGPLASTTESELLQQAFTHRPDLLALGFQRERADAAIALARRLRYPDISLGLQYSQWGTGQYALSPPLVLFTVSATLPAFYAQEGEIQRAQADLTTQQLTQQKVQAQIVSDVTTAWSLYRASRSLVERMESATLDRATVARDITEKQFRAGSTTLMDFLDAQRTYIATKQEYLQDRANYWGAVYQLEQAVGMELRK